MKSAFGLERVGMTALALAMAAMWMDVQPVRAAAPTISETTLADGGERIAQAAASALDPGAGPATPVVAKPATAVSAASAATGGAGETSTTGGAAEYRHVESGNTATARSPLSINPVVPSQTVSGQKFTSNPPASEAVDSLEREPAVGPPLSVVGRHLDDDGNLAGV